MTCGKCHHSCLQSLKQQWRLSRNKNDYKKSLQTCINYTLQWHKAMSCYGLIAYVKEVAVLLYGWALGIVGAGQRGSREEVHLWLGTVQKRGMKQQALTHITEICKDFFLLKFLQVFAAFTAVCPALWQLYLHVHSMCSKSLASECHFWAFSSSTIEHAKEQVFSSSFNVEEPK